MLDHMTGYEELRDKRKRSTMKLIESDISNLQIFEKILGFQYAVQKKVHPVFKNRRDQLINGQNHAKEHLAKDITFNLCSYNIEYLFAAMETLKGGHMHASFSTIRPVYESIPKIFYVHHNPEDAFYILLQAQYDLNRLYREYECFKTNTKNHRMEILEEFLTDAKKSSLANGSNMDTNHVDKKFRQTLTNKYYRKKVYTDEQLAIQNITYAMLSSNSHANVTRFDGFARDYDENRSKFVKILVDVTFINFFLLTSICHEELKDLGEIKNTSNFMTEIDEEVGDLLYTTDLFPQKQEYIENLFIKPTENADNGKT